MTLPHDGAARRNPDPWNTVARTLADIWPGQFNRDVFASYRRVLEGRYAPEVVIASIANLVSTGAKFYPRPSASEIAAECNTIARPELREVSWTAFWTSFQAAGKHRDYPRSDTPAGKAAFVGQTVSAELGPIAGAFAASINEGIAREPLGDTDKVGAIVARYSKDWREFQADHRGRALRGGHIPTPAQVLQRSDRTPLVLIPASQGLAVLPTGGQS